MIQADFGVGLEGGLKEHEDGSLDCIAYMVIVRARDGRESSAQTASFPLPPRISRLVAGAEPGQPKMELGDARRRCCCRIPRRASWKCSTQADDFVFGTVNSNISRRDSKAARLCSHTNADARSCFAMSSCNFCFRL